MNQYEIWLSKEQQWSDDMAKEVLKRNHTFALLCLPVCALALGLINLLCGGSITEVLRCMLYGLLFGALILVITLLCVHKPDTTAYMDGLKKQAAVFSPEQQEEMARQLMSSDAICIQYKQDMGSRFSYDKAIITKDWFLSSGSGSGPLLFKLNQVSQVLTDTKSFSYRAGGGGYRLRIKEHYYTIQFCFYDKNPALPDGAEAVIALDNRNVRDQIAAAIHKQSGGLEG